jgi:hypothetical protein
MRLRDSALTDEFLRKIPKAREQFRAVAENSFKASFLDEGAKNRLLEELKS